MRTKLILMALACASASSAATAKDCGPLKQVNSMELTLAQNGTRALVPVTINGTKKEFMVDTGGSITQISRDMAQELKLPLTEGHFHLVDLYGHASNDAVMIKSFGLGRMQDRDTTIMINPNPDFAKDAPYVGLLAPDYMGEYDVDLDFGTGKLNYFSPDHCDGHVVYWHTTALAIVPISFVSYRIRVPITLDGHSLTAVIDTGAPRTTITTETARRLFGLTEDTPGNVPLGMSGGKKIFGHVFASLDFQGVAVTNPYVEVLPDLVGSKDPNNGPTGTLTKRQDDILDDLEVILGMDVLKSLHLYIAFEERKLYVSAADSSAAAQESAALPPVQ